MLALLLIQAFQTVQLYDRKSSQFKSKVSTSLERIALRHEKAEDIRRYMHIVNRDFSGQYKDILKEEFQNLLAAQESISIQDTSIFENGEMQRYLIIKGKSFDSLAGLTAEHRVLARDVRQLRDLFDRQSKKVVIHDTANLAGKLDQRVMQQIFKKAKFINEMLLDAFRYNVYDEPLKRIDVEFLDSVIHSELKDDQLPLDYQFMVTLEDKSPINFKLKTPNYSIDIDTLLTNHTLLFPSNVLDEKLILQLFFPSKQSFLIREMWGSLTISLSLMILIVLALSFMFRTILTQKRLSELKNDFISNMTHEFKTPISTIALACEAMSDKDMMGPEQSKAAPFVKMIHEENNRLSLLVERILQSAQMDRGQLSMKIEKILLTEIIHDIAQNAQFRIDSLGGKINLELPQELIEVNADRMHLAGIISNLVDNGIKYSYGPPLITIRLVRQGEDFVLSVIDKGIGIKKEHITKIFDKLYRIPTGNIHNVKGFGLGLSYVKEIAELHNWEITVNSKFGVGSEFILTLKNTL
jgi:two-component system phosphate regulon sensor histidine kinase PhoR